MIELNQMTGIPALIVGILVMVSFRHYALRFCGPANIHFGIAIFWMAFQFVARSVWWDWFNGFGLGNPSNVVWNAFAWYAGYQALKGYMLLIPPQDRNNYNILTVAFYPHRLWRKMHGEDERKTND
jgi:hypothetical protein